jgi:hypothetical protein
MNRDVLLLFLGGILCLFLSCKDRLDTIGTFPTSPGLKIFAKGVLNSSVTDSIKLTNPNYKYYGLDLHLSDTDRYYTSLSYQYNQGSGIIINRGDTVHGLLPFFDYRSQSTFFPVGEGLTRITFTASDQFHNTASANISLLAFKNLSPVAFFSVTPLRNIDSLEYLINASGSYDQDQNFGGGLVQYKYTVERDTILTAQNSIKHIFSAPGVFTISLQVQDNDGSFSKIVTQQITATKK